MGQRRASQKKPIKSESDEGKVTAMAGKIKSDYDGTKAIVDPLGNYFFKK